METITFANVVARGTDRQYQTSPIELSSPEHSSTRFLGDPRLDLWNIDGQDVSVLRLSS
jgi:hypothetical protein